MPEIVIIAAMTRDRVIGKDNKLPWHLPEDLRRFKELTKGHPIIMGRKTFESILNAIGRPLPNRHSIVLSTTKADWDGEGVSIARNWGEAINIVKDEPRVFVGGGEVVFEDALALADRLELTVVHGDYEGDAFFPPFEHLIGPVFDLEDISSGEGCSFLSYTRQPQPDVVSSIPSKSTMRGLSS